VPSGAASLSNPYTGDANAAVAGEKLFASMNCDGCHGGGALGFTAPSLADGRCRVDAGHLRDDPPGAARGPHRRVAGDALISALS